MFQKEYPEGVDLQKDHLKYLMYFARSAIIKNQKYRVDGDDKDSLIKYILLSDRTAKYLKP